MRIFNIIKNGAIVERAMSIGEIHNQSALPGGNRLDKKGFRDLAGGVR